MKILRIISSILGLILVPFSSVNATEIIHYKDIPITIHLQKGQERSIEFGDHVQVGVTAGQKQKRLFRVQSAQGIVHILPNKTFDKTRVQIKRITDKRVILVDFISNDMGTNAIPLEPVRIVLNSENAVKNSQVGFDRDYSERAHITPVDLARYAAQHLYGPARLHKGVPGITKASIGVKGAVKIFKGSNKLTTASTPIVAYRGGGYYLTGMHVKNISDKRIELDYLDLNLPFTHATFQHHVLAPKGNPGDNTILYLASDKPLKETLYPWTYYQDNKQEAIALSESVQNQQKETDALNRRKHHRK